MKIRSGSTMLESPSTIDHLGCGELRLPDPGDDIELFAVGRSLVCDSLPALPVGDIRYRQSKSQDAAILYQI